MDESQKITLGERSQTQKSTFCVIPFMKFKTSNTTVVEVGSGVYLCGR